MRPSPEVQAITTYLMGAVQYATEEDGLAEVEALVGGNLRLAREVRRDLDSRSMWPRGRWEGLLGSLREDYQYDRAMRILDAVIEGVPLAPPPIELRPLFDSDRRADDVVLATDELVYQGVTDEEILRQMTGKGLTEETKRRLLLRSDMKSAVTSNQKRAARLLRTLGGEPSVDDPEPVIPGLNEFYDLSDEEAFQRIALEVPQLLSLRNALGPEPAPIPSGLTFRDFMRHRRSVRNGPNAASQKEWEGQVRQVISELRRLVGPGAEEGSELVRSDIALFKCAQVVLPMGSGFSPDNGGIAS